MPPGQSTLVGAATQNVMYRVKLLGKSRLCSIHYTGILAATFRFLVPQEFYKKLTPGFQQWWTIKADHFDSVIMFKVGKFYELYHMDAVIGVRELGLVFMKAEFAHCGFPEAGFGRYSDSLVQKGYRVVRVEQVETPAMMEQRIKKMGGATKSDRVVQREVCSIITKGTRTLNFFDGAVGDADSVFLLAIKELPIAEPIYNKIYGVCFVDTCLGNFCLGQFRDDAESSRLRTLFAHYPPGHVLYERRGLLPHTSHLIDLLLPSSVKDALVPGVEFWDASKTMQVLAEGHYFEGDCTSSVQWPHSLKAMLSEGGNCGNDVVGFNIAADFELAVSSLGACVWCLKQAHLDYSLLSLASFEFYNVQNFADRTLNKSTDETVFSSQRLILDDITLTNLDIISDTPAGTLLEKLDTTVTAFGKRLLRRWVCAPLASVSAIETRQDAMEQLVKNPSVMAQAKAILCKLPDLERLLRKIHSQGCHTISTDHPDARAIFFEHVKYSKRKIADFISVLDGFNVGLKVLEVFSPVLESSKESTLLCKLLCVKDGGFPDLEKQLTFYANSFDTVKAKAEGIIIPNQGVNQQYDSSQEQVNSILEELNQYLIQQKRRLNCKNVTYWGTGRNRFQLEIPVSSVSSPKLEAYELTSQRKGFRRYRTPAIDKMLKKLTVAEEIRDKCLRDTMENLFHSFDLHFAMWEQAVQCLSVLDVLMSLATYSLSASEEMTRPVLVEPSTSALLEIQCGYHPCIVHTYCGGEYIPNDVIIEGQRSCLLVTGPNMGGKSTLMRQTGLLIVLAQLGCYVPAAKCKLSPVDRIFTRMGAHDRIMARESTFFVELKETCSILRHATCHSLVLVDELGRGTATYDGAAIACAVVQQLAQVLRCRTLFSTHYHFLVDQFVGNPYVQLGHMACMVEGEQESITFLYKFTEGACPKSYGFNVAKLAGLPSNVIALAKRKAMVCEREAQHVRILRRLLRPSLVSSDLKRIIAPTPS